MAFNNFQNNSKDNTISMNTRGYQFMNSKGFEPSTLSFGYWNEMISLRINPALPPEKQTDNKFFDYDQTIATSITLEKACALFKQITDDVLPAIANGEDKNVGIQVAGDTLIVVGTGKKYTENPVQYFAIHKSINPETKIPEMSVFYEFRTLEVIKDYDEKTGNYNVINGISSEFQLFVLLLKAAIEALGNANAHADRNVNKWANQKNANNISAIADKVGAQTRFDSSYRQRNNVSWGSNNSDSSSSTSITEDAAINELSNIEDINAFLS